MTVKWVQRGSISAVFVWREIRYSSRNTVRLEKYSTVREIQYSSRNTVQFLQYSTVWEIQYSSRNTVRFEKYSTVEKSSTVHEIQYSSWNTVQFAKYSTVWVWEIQHSSPAPRGYWFLYNSPRMYIVQLPSGRERERERERKREREIEGNDWKFSADLLLTPSLGCRKSGLAQVGGRGEKRLTAGCWTGLQMCGDWKAFSSRAFYRRVQCSLVEITSQNDHKSKYKLADSLS